MKSIKEAMNEAYESAKRNQHQGFTHLSSFYGGYYSALRDIADGTVSLESKSNDIDDEYVKAEREAIAQMLKSYCDERCNCVNCPFQNTHCEFSEMTLDDLRRCAAMVRI